MATDLEKKTPLILIIEDNEFMKKILLDCLRGYSCSYAKTCQQGMELFQEKMPDIVFLDMFLPDGSGLDLVRSMIAQNNKIFIAIVSGENGPEITKKAQNYGVKAYISKPYSKAQIDQCMEKFFQEN